VLDHALGELLACMFRHVLLQEPAQEIAAAGDGVAIENASWSRKEGWSTAGCSIDRQSLHGCQHPQRRYQDPLHLFLPHWSSLQPWRIAHSRKLRSQCPVRDRIADTPSPASTGGS